MSNSLTKLSMKVEYESEDNKIKLINSYSSLFDVVYETTTCRGNNKKWKAIILADYEEDAAREFMKYIETKKHIANCNILDISYHGMAEMDFGGALMEPVKNSQVLSFKNDPRVFLKAKIPQTEEWFIPSTLNIYKAEMCYNTKQGNMKIKNIYTAGFDTLDAQDSIFDYLEAYKIRNKDHVFKERILSTKWIGELKLIL